WADFRPSGRAGTSPADRPLSLTPGGDGCENDRNQEYPMKSVEDYPMAQLSALRFLLLGLTAALVGAAPARAADQALIDAAKKEGEVVWYTTLIVDQLARPMVAAFEKKYPGIKVSTFRANSTDVVIKVINEGKAGKVQADLVDGTSTTGAL